MKKITITDDEFKQKVVAEVSSDATVEDIFMAIRGLLVAVGYSYDNIRERLNE